MPRSRATKLFHFQLSTRTSVPRLRRARMIADGGGRGTDSSVSRMSISRNETDLVRFLFFRREFFSFDMRGKFQIFEISGIIKGERKGNPLTVSIRPEARNRNRIKTNLQRQRRCLKKDSISVLLDSLLARQQSSRLHLSATIFPKNFPRK